MTKYVQPAKLSSAEMARPPPPPGLPSVRGPGPDARGALITNDAQLTDAPARIGRPGEWRMIRNQWAFRTASTPG